MQTCHPLRINSGRDWILAICQIFRLEILAIQLRCKVKGHTLCFCFHSVATTVSLKFGFPSSAWRYSKREYAYIWKKGYRLALRSLSWRFISVGFIRLCPPRDSGVQTCCLWRRSIKRRKNKLSIIGEASQTRGTSREATEKNISRDNKDPSSPNDTYNS